MKPLLIGLGVVVVLCCAGGIGIFLWGKGAVDSFRGDAKAYGDQAVSAIATNWDVKELEDRAAPELISQVGKEALAAVCRPGRENYGPMRSFTGTTSMQIQAKSTTEGGTYSTIPYKAELECEKGKAQLDLMLIKRKDEFRILSINLSPR